MTSAERVAVVGTGLIGTSIAMAAIRAGEAVRGFDIDTGVLAEAARRMGLGRVPLLCAQEIPVEGSMRGVIRVLLQFHTELGAEAVAHVYLDGAETLRDDLG